MPELMLLTEILDHLWLNYRNFFLGFMILLNFIHLPAYVARRKSGG